MAQATSDNQRKTDYLPYNGEPLQDDQALVPQLITPDYADLIQAQGVRFWHKCGVVYPVMFVPVPAEQAQIAWQAFNADVNGYLDEQLGPNRYSRCMIPQPDGSTKPCPKETNGRRNTCSSCPYRGKLEKEDRNQVSLESLDEENYHPMSAAPSAEDCAMLGFLLKDLLDDFSDKCPHYADIIRLGYEGLGKKEIIQELPVFNNCKKETEAYLKN